MRRLSFARRQALALAQQAKRDKVIARRAALRVPKPFRSAPDFLSCLAALARARAGANRAMADACKVNTSTASKWLRGKKTPTQPNLDALAAWWRAHRDDQPDTPAPATPRQLSAARLPENISARLRRAATLRGIKPMEYLAQILDRQLPRLEEML